jgi:hypothetical protein
MLYKPTDRIIRSNFELFKFKIYGPGKVNVLQQLPATR